MEKTEKALVHCGSTGRTSASTGKTFSASVTVDIEDKFKAKK